MRFLTKDGNIEEGISLTPDEEDFVATNAAELNSHVSSTYLSEKDGKKILYFLLSKYKVTPRQPEPELRNEYEQTVVIETEVPF